MPLKPIHRSALTAVAALSLAGCGSGPAGPSAETYASSVDGPPLGPIRAHISSAMLTLPLDAYEPSAKDRAVVRRARAKLVNNCLAPYGLKLSIPTREITYPKNANYLGWLGDKRVDVYGYAGPPDLIDDIAAAATGVLPFSIPDAQFAVLEGKVRKVGGEPVPKGGCDAVAESLLDKGAVVPSGTGRPKRHAERQLYVLADDVAASAYNDARLRDAAKPWSACMAEAGFEYASPADAEGDPRWASTAADEHTAPARGGKTEIEVATADHRCRLDTGYYGLRQAVYAAYQQRVIEEHRPLLESLRALVHKRLENARRIIAGSGKVTAATRP